MNPSLSIKNDHLLCKCMLPIKKLVQFTSTQANMRQAFSPSPHKHMPKHMYKTDPAPALQPPSDRRDTAREAFMLIRTAITKPQRGP